MSEQTFRVLVRGPTYLEPGGAVERLEWAEVSEAEYIRYSLGDVNWRSAAPITGKESFWSRTWRRLREG